jgi:uncharacterized membrane protein YraQ (UPF0718 family)
MWYLYFSLALICHLAISVLLGWVFRSRFHYSSVPKPGTVNRCRELATAINAQQGTEFSYSDFMRFHTTETQGWSVRQWVIYYFLIGLLIAGVILVIHICSPATI